MMGQVHDLQASLTDATDKNKELQITLSQNQLDIEERDRVISKQTEDLKACKEEIDFINREKKEEDEKIATLEINSDDQVRHGKEVFKEKYLIYALGKGFMYFNY